MDRRAFTLSLVFAMLAGFMVYSYLDGKEGELTTQYGNQIPVVVAKVDIKELEVIDDRKIKIINVPRNYASPGHFNRIEDLYNTIAATPILSGEQVTKTRITYPGAQSGLSRQVSLGKRAMSIQVSEYQVVSKLIKPGDRVDVLALVDYARGKKELLKVKTVLQDILVLSTGLSITNSIPLVGVKVQDDIKGLNLNNYTDYNTITLELTPYEVQKIIFLIETGSRIHLSLRNNDDKSIERVQTTRLFDVLDTDSAEAKAYYEQQMNKPAN